MFDQIVDLVKEHLGNNPQVNSAVPPGQQDELHREIAGQITNGLSQQAGTQGGIGGLLSQLEAGLTSGSPVTNAIEGGLIGSLTSKFGLPPAATGAIAAALPSILQKLAHRANDPNDPRLTPGGLSGMFSGGAGGLGSLFGGR
jgi:hypothetical protein